MIEVDALSLTRDGNRILDAISAHLPATGLTAIIGPNGTGKSTLLHVIAGLLDPTAGRVTLDGVDVHVTATSERAKMLAILTQSQAQVPRLIVADLVAFGRWPHHRGRPTAQDHALVAEAIAQFELNNISHAQIDALSGGQRQRAYIAMAWAQATPYLLLDEPLSALDPRIAKAIMGRLHELSRKDRAAIIVLHDLQIAAQWADHVVALKDGALFAEGPAAEVLADDPLSALYDTEITVRTLEDGRIAVLT